MSPKEAFRRAYMIELARQHALKPDCYRWPISELPAIVDKMLAALATSRERVAGMTQEQFRATLKAAYAADDAFQAACERAGYKSRWDVGADAKRSNAAISCAYDAKVRADAVMHLAFEAMRLERETW